jgi:probable rRNA maturation factor
MKEQVFKYKAGVLRCQDSQRNGKFKLKAQKKIFTIFLEELHLFLNKSLLFVGNFEEVSLTLHYCGKTKIKNLNTNFRDKPKVTDVLSFPLFDSFRVKGDFIPPLIDLGDIFICREVAISQSREYKLSLEQEVLRQLIHGFLHLLGFDHELSKKEEDIMLSLQEDMFKKISIKLGWTTYAGR